MHPYDYPACPKTIDVFFFASSVVLPERSSSVGEIILFYNSFLIS